MMSGVLSQPSRSGSRSSSARENNNGVAVRQSKNGHVGGAGLLGKIRKYTNRNEPEGEQLLPLTGITDSDGYASASDISAPMVCGNSENTQRNPLNNPSSLEWKEWDEDADGNRVASRCCTLSVMILLICVLLGGIVLILSVHNFIGMDELMGGAGMVMEDKEGFPVLWSTKIKGYGSESPVRVVHVPSSSSTVILCGVVSYSTDSEGTLGAILAFEGNTGRSLYRIQTPGEIFEITCRLRLQHSGPEEGYCVATGRHSSLVAFQPQNGFVLWRSEDVSGELSVFGSVPIDDADGDGIEELVVAYGGNSSYGPEDHVRESDYLLLISGATGRVLGRLITPDKKETYCLPALYQGHGGDHSKDFLLFGTGGETVSGSLYFISVKDFVSVALNGSLPRSGPCCMDQWPTYERDANGVGTIYRSETRGIMVPPVQADLNGDSYYDIVLASFDGNLTAFNGRHLFPLWTITSKEDYEGYSSPGLLMYDGDNVPDVTYHWNEGEWPHYNSSMSIVLSGTDGTLLHAEVSSFGGFSSDISLTTSHGQGDVLLYREKEQVRHAEVGNDNNGRHGDSTKDGDRRRRRRHGGAEVGIHPDADGTCDHIPLTKVTVRGLHKSTSSEPTVIATRVSENRKYSSDGVELCTSFGVMEMSTGAIADVDGDGNLDLVMLLWSHAARVEAHKHSSSSISLPADQSTGRKIRDGHNGNENTLTSVAKESSGIHDNLLEVVVIPLGKPMQDLIRGLKVLPEREQAWSAYQGSHGDGRWRT